MKEQKQKAPFFVLRAVIAFVLLGLLCGVLYWWGYHGYGKTAAWIEPGHHEAFVLKDVTYYRVGQIGKGGLTDKKYPKDAIVGYVKDDGLPMVTEPVTEAETEEADEDYEDTETAEETEPVTEPVTVIPPKGAELFEEGKHAFVIYSVKDTEEYLLLLESDGKYYLYSIVDPAETETNTDM